MAKYSIEEKFFARLITLTRYESNHRRQLDFDIDLEYLMLLWNAQQGLCALSNKPMDMKRSCTTSRTNPDVCTIDRIDSGKGYVKGNIQLVRWLLNRIKINLSQDEFLDVCNSVVKTLSH